ncbi:ATP synthase subunit b [Nitrosomonas stercoris]|uniref:ATP synthase subunit b n=1 Tax=Nitrosomonas stercoris TaxID=1444684 RepID=A0A4Y1YLQ6_9PROT|nr:ATP synthase subunit b [Nitrosomonas stercoris]
MNINFTLVSQAIAFFILIWFTAKFIWPYLLRAIEERQQQIADGLAAGERGKKELELASRRSADVLKDAKQRASEIIGQAEKRASDIVEEAKQNAKNEGDKILAGARAEIQNEMLGARESLRKQVAGLAIQGASKILHREINPEVHADLLASIEAELK